MISITPDALTVFGSHIIKQNKMSETQLRQAILQYCPAHLAAPCAVGGVLTSQGQPSFVSHIPI